MPRVLDPKAKKLIEQAAAATRCDAVAAVEPFIEKLRELGVEKQAAERAVRRARQKTAKAATIKSTTPQSSVAAESWRKSRSLDSSVGQVLEQVGLHRAGPQRYLTNTAMDIRVRSAGAFRIAAVRAEHHDLRVLHLNAIVGAAASVGLVVEMLRAIAQLKEAGGFTSLRWIGMQGLAVHEAGSASAYLPVMDALDAVLGACAERSEWILGVNLGELPLSAPARIRVRATFERFNIPRFYFSANYAWKKDLQRQLTADRRNAEAALRQAGEVPWWCDVRNRSWLGPAANDARAPPHGHGCEQGFRRGLGPERPPMGIFFWNESNF